MSTDPHPHAALITRFYEAFARRDGAAMTACYHPEATFSDPAFADLKGDQPGAMWRMLCHRGKDLEVVFSEVQADDESGSAHWDATYTFGATGRKVHNKIDAAFRFKDGLIIEHVDTFDFYTWSKQALGMPGLLLGWTGFLKNKVGSQAMAGLDKWMAREAEKGEDS